MSEVGEELSDPMTLIARLSVDRARALNRIQAAQKYLAGMEPTAETSDLLALLSGPSERGKP